MIYLLRFIGVMNAAVWFGGAVSFTFNFAPMFFTPEVKETLGGDLFPGLIAQVAVQRFFYQGYWCGGIALVHAVAEWVYSAKAFDRITIQALTAVLGLGLLGGLALQPHLRSLHLTKYGVRSTPEARVKAARSFKIWHGVSQAANLLSLVGLFVYTWRTLNTTDGPRFLGPTKFRG